MSYKPQLLAIPAEVWDIALGWEKTKLATGFTKVPNYTALNEEHRYQKGYVGEITYRELLVTHNIKHVYRVHLDGRSHDAEFLVWRRSGQLVRIDVKFNARVRGTDFMMPAAQYARHAKTVDVYVGIQLVNDTTATLHGWIAREDFAKVMTKRELKCPTVLCPYATLTDIEELLDDLQKNFLVPVGGQLELF